MNFYEALDTLSGYFDMLIDMGILSDEEENELNLIEDTIRHHLIRKD